LIAGQEILTAEFLDLSYKLTPDLLLGDVRSHLFLFSSRLEGIDNLYKDRILDKKEPSVNHNLFFLSRKRGRREAPGKDDDGRAAVLRKSGLEIVCADLQRVVPEAGSRDLQSVDLVIE
jgi:hypothetical protein